MTVRDTSTSDRALAAAAGKIPFFALSPEERIAAHSLIDARIAGRVTEQRFGLATRSAGHATVSLDDDGTVVEIAPDGSCRSL